MKTIFLFRFIAVIFTMSLFIATVSQANWQQKRETSNLKLSQSGAWERGSDNNTPNISNNSNTRDNQHSKSDLLPEGVTKDCLNSLTDENGNKIIQDNETSRTQEDPEGDALQRKIFNGFAAANNFGTSASSAGDVNGDGYNDIIVGANGYSGNTGRAYIFYGGANMNTVPDVIMTGEAASNNFGISVSTAGDVNGDGYSDVIVGAQGYSSSTGRAYIFFGGASMNNAVDVILTGETTNNSFGYSVSLAGDVNGDGYSDVITGAIGYSSGTGRAYIYFGGSSMNNVSDVIMTGEAVNNSFGISVSSAGDMNGDGYSDVVAGASGYSSNTGRVYVYFGSSSMNNAADVTMTGVAVNNSFGISVSGAADVNGDGYSDVIAGANDYASGTGRVYIFFGSSSVNNAADVIMTGEGGGNYLGISVSNAGDVNGDGYSDVIAGAYGYGSGIGRAYIFFGGSVMNNLADVTVTGDGSTTYNFGRCVSSAGDVNGDGYSDAIVCEYSYNSSTGRVYLYDYFLKNEIIKDQVFTGSAPGDYFSNSVSSAGDFNGDGYSDVAVSASNFNSLFGGVYVYYGGQVMDNVADLTLSGVGVQNYFGASVSSGDVNGDGYSDLIIGAPGFNVYTGRAYIYYGSSSPDNTPDVTIGGVVYNPYAGFGSSVSSAGDLNGDGYTDVIIGANGDNSNTGKTYIYFGGSSMNNVEDVTMTGEAVNNYFGSSVSACDVNGDGYSDAIVGAYGNTTNTGKAYIYYGGYSMNNVADVIMTGEATGNKFGYSVSNAGDVNRDGYSDAIVGAYGYSSSTGRSYIYYGGSIMNNVADVTMTGETTNNQFGFSVAAAGDMNSDGYSDVIVGANTYNSNTGRAYLFFGGSTMNNVSDVTMSGEGTNYSFGYAVSSAGDVNGDGYLDLITGATDYNSSTGRSYIYLGSAISPKPILNYVKDVPNDQGGKVSLKWARSAHDISSNNLITSYSVFRSFPPSGGNFAWQEVATVTARLLPFYSYIDNTPYDSTSGNSGTFFYRIRANTSNISEFWYSGMISGRSIDNIAPLMLSPFTAAPIINDVRLNWKRSASTDLLNYVLYRSTSPTIDINTQPVFATTTDSTYLDTSPLSGVYYYFAVAQDIHNNKSPVAVAESPNMTLNLTMFIEGFYNSGTNSQVSDTITVQLRNSVSPFALVDAAKAVVTSSGNAVLKFGDAPSGQYYIVVKHRNSIETWSKAGGEIFTVSGTVNYNLTTTSSQAFGNNIISVDASPVRFAVYSGDVNQDGIIDGSDISDVENDAAIALSGYVKTDLTGDNFVDASDVSVVENNAAISVSVITP